MPTKARNRILAAVRELAALPSLSASPATVDHLLERICSAGAQVTFAKLDPGSEVRIEVALELGLTVHDFIPLFATCPGTTFTNPAGAPQPYCLALRVPAGELRITCPTLSRGASGKSSCRRWRASTGRRTPPRELVPRH